MVSIKVKKLDSRAVIPSCGSLCAAGSDLYALLDGDGEVTIPAHHTVMIHTGLSIELPEGYFGAIFARSGLATREGLRPANCVGVVDSDYRGEVMVALHNDSELPCSIKSGERVAQLVVMPYLPVAFEEVAELSDTARGEGGFGSTGK